LQTKIRSRFDANTFASGVDCRRIG
jgi:hypothetical protein